MTPKRNTIPKLTARALKKCTQFYQDAVHVYCTPAEYFALLLHFNAFPRNKDYYLAKIAKGDCAPGTHYIHVNKWNDVFPRNKHACLDAKMCMPY